MAFAVAEAAVEAGSAIVLLPAAHHPGGWSEDGDLPPAPGQRRFCDPDVDTFLARVDGLRSWAASVPGVSVGIAAHSVRGGPRGSERAGGPAGVALGDRRVLRARGGGAARPCCRAAPRARRVPGRAR